MNGNRNVVITGAGAVIPWGAPSTECLTNLLRNDDVFINEKGEKIGEFLYELLLKNRNVYNINPRNFESILHFIEVLYQYKLPEQASYGSSFRPDEFYILPKRIENRLKSFEKSNPNFKSDGSRLDTAYGNEKVILKESYYKELYSHFLFLIKEKVQAYDKVGNNNELNDLFRDFLESLKTNNSILRYYTLNYDYLPTKLTGIKFFDGYNKKGIIDIPKIKNKNNIDCYYNLHGSFELNFVGEKSENCDLARTVKDYSGNYLIPTNIISGYNKVFRIFGDTYFHIYQKFIDDCYNADHIYIIGYSFGDLHINRAIRTAMQKGKAQITYVDKLSYCKDNKDYIAKIDSLDIGLIKVTSGTDYIFERSLLKSANKIKINESGKLYLYLDGTEDFLTSVRRNI